MIIGTAGHIDHGKTALVRALTGVDTDRLKEEKARGMVALTKVDLVGPERRARARTEVADALAGTALASAAIVPVSTVTGEGIEDLRAGLFAAARAHGGRAASGRFRLAVDRSFTLAGAGTIVTGTVLSGSVRVGDRLIISPSGLSARVRSLHAQNRPTERGQAGERCALNLVGEDIGKDAISRGDIVLDPALHAPAERIDATLRVLGSQQKPIGPWTPVRLHHAAAEVGARVVPLSEQMIPPGGEGTVQLVLDRAIAAAAGDRFVLRDTSAQRTIGGGCFLDLRAPARRRRTPERLAQLAALALADPEQALSALLAGPASSVDLATFARDRALVDADVEAMAERLAFVRIPAPDGKLALAEPTWQRLGSAVRRAVQNFHADNPDRQGMALEPLRKELDPRLPPAVFTALVQALARAGELSLDGALVRLPRHEVQLKPEDDAIWRRIEPLIGGAERFRPPRVADLAERLRVPEAAVRRLLKLLARMGRLDEIAPDHFFLRATVAAMVDIACDLAEKSNGQFAAAQFRDRLDNGRKVAIQILEFFDRHGITLRRGDLRRVNPQRRHLFATPAAGGHASSGRDASPVGRPDFKSGRGREPVLGGFDSHSLPPPSRGSR